jgi:hypothetical protein
MRVPWTSDVADLAAEEAECVVPSEEDNKNGSCFLFPVSSPSEDDEAAVVLRGEPALLAVRVLTIVLAVFRFSKTSIMVVVFHLVKLGTLASSLPTKTNVPEPLRSSSR